MLGAVCRCYQRFAFPEMGRVVLPAELGRFTADADTVPGFRERLHNRCALIAHDPGRVAGSPSHDRDG